MFKKQQNTVCSICSKHSTQHYLQNVFLNKLNKTFIALFKKITIFVPEIKTLFTKTSIDYVYIFYYCDCTLHHQTYVLSHLGNHQTYLWHFSLII